MHFKIFITGGDSFGELNPGTTPKYTHKLFQPMGVCMNVCRERKVLNCWHGGLTRVPKVGVHIGRHTETYRQRQTYTQA